MATTRALGTTLAPLSLGMVSMLPGECGETENRMTRRSSYWLSLVIVAIAVVCCGAVVLYVCKQSDIATIQRIASIGAIVAAITGFVALMVLVIYTRETYLLRVTAELQLESSIQPLVLLEILAEERPIGEPPVIQNLQLRNIGAGPAFGAIVAPINGHELSLSVSDVPLIEAGECQIVTATIVYACNEKRSGEFALAILGDALFKGKFPSDPSVLVDFRSISQKLYRVTQKITKPDLQTIRTEFISMTLISD